MKRMIVPALALACAVGYGKWLYDELDGRIRSVGDAQQKNAVAMKSLSDSLAQREIILRDPTAAVSFGGSIDLHTIDLRTTALDDRLADDTIARNAHLIGQRLNELGSDAASTHRALAGYQEQLLETNELLEGLSSDFLKWEKLGSTIAHEQDVVFQRMVTTLYDRTQQRIHAKHKERNYNTQGPQFHIFYAVDDILIEALKAGDAETVYMLHLVRPSEASRQTFEKELARCQALCDPFSMKPTMRHRICHHGMPSSWSSFQTPFKYVLEVYPDMELTSYPSRDHVLIHHENLRDGRVKITGVEYIPPSKK